jgi:hypothetical protein
MPQSGRQSRGEASPIGYYADKLANNCAGDGLSSRAHNRKISTGHLVVSCHLAVTLYRNCLLSHVAPNRMAEIDGDEISDIARTDEVDGKPRVFEAHIYARCWPAFFKSRVPAPLLAP